VQWLRSKLGRKFAIGTAAGLLASSLVFVVLFFVLYQNELATERADTAAQVNQLLQTSLENAMLKRDLDGLRSIVSQLGNQPGIESVVITNPAGEIRFADDDALLGQRRPLPAAQQAAFTRFVTLTSGREVLRSVNPVANHDACKECHGPRSASPVNGVLYVDYDAAQIRRKALLTTLILMGAGAVIVILNLTGGWWFMHRYVLRPVGQLTATSQALTNGDLHRRAAPSGDDELAVLGRAFNEMADQLQLRIAEAEQQRGFLQALIDAIPDGIRVIAPDYTVVMTNHAYREQLGSDNDGVGDMCYRVSHQCDRSCASTLLTCPVHEIRQHGRPVKVLHRHYDNQGNAADVEIYAAPLVTTYGGIRQQLVVESIRDLSKQIKYSHEQKLSELGKIATGVAHEIHNPLASIRLALDGLRREAGHVGPDTLDYLALVDREIEKCVTFTERLLKLGMQPSEQAELVDVANVIEDTLGLVRWEAEQLGVELQTALVPGLRVLASDSEMRMVVLNLAQNAFHAMPRGGHLAVSSQARASQIVITVQDTGLGIEAGRLSRIFEPFYSRRADGSNGAGLGLSIVRTIIEKYGGSVEVSSEPGRGSLFSVTLPDPGATYGDDA
jgi:signal transduction histidine kinase